MVLDHPRPKSLYNCPIVSLMRCSFSQRVFPLISWYDTCPTTKPSPRHGFYGHIIGYNILSLRSGQVATTVSSATAAYVGNGRSTCLEVFTVTTCFLDLYGIIFNALRRWLFYRIVVPFQSSYSLVMIGSHLTKLGWSRVIPVELCTQSVSPKLDNILKKS